MANRLEVTSLLQRNGRAEGVVCRCGVTGDDGRDPGRQRDQRDGSLGRPDPPGRDHRRDRGPADRALARHPRDPAAGDAAARRRRLHRPGRQRPDDLRPALVRAGARRHDRQRLRRRHRPRAAGRRRRRLPARGRQRVLRHVDRAWRPDRCLRRRPAADLDRRPEEVGRHLPQGGALRDLIGDADDHRRQADHLAADGEAGRRPGRDARGARAPLPDRGHPARHGGGRPRTSSRRPGSTPRQLPEGFAKQLAFRYGHASRDGAGDRRRAPRAGPADRRGPPRPARRGGRRRSARAGAQPSATCCCAAPGSRSSPPRSCAMPTR